MDSKDSFDRYLQAKIEETLIFKKYWNYMEFLLEKSNFQGKIKNLRKKYKIPLSGLPITEKIGRVEDVAKVAHRLGADCLSEDSENLAEEFGLNCLWNKAIGYYVLFNKLERTLHPSMIEILDINRVLNGVSGSKRNERAEIRLLRDLAKTSPVAIIINTYVSQKEIIDYVKKLHHPLIKSIQDHYKRPGIKLGKIRSKNQRVKEIARFAFDNGEKGIMELTNLVNSKFGEIYDYSYVRRILKEEKRKKSLHG